MQDQPISLWQYLVAVVGFSLHSSSIWPLVEHFADGRWLHLLAIVGIYCAVCVPWIHLETVVGILSRHWSTIGSIGSMKPPFLGLGVCMALITCAVACATIMRAGSVTLLLAKLWVQDAVSFDGSLSCDYYLPRLLKNCDDYYNVNGESQTHWILYEVLIAIACCVVLAAIIVCAYKAPLRIAAYATAIMLACLLFGLAAWNISLLGETRYYSAEQSNIDYSSESHVTDAFRSALRLSAAGLGVYSTLARRLPRDRTNYRGLQIIVMVSPVVALAVKLAFALLLSVPLGKIFELRGVASEFGAGTQWSHITFAVLPSALRDVDYPVIAMTSFWILMLLIDLMTAFFLLHAMASVFVDLFQKTRLYRAFTLLIAIPLIGVALLFAQPVHLKVLERAEFHLYPAVAVAAFLLIISACIEYGFWKLQVDLAEHFSISSKSSFRQRLLTPISSFYSASWLALITPATLFYVNVTVLNNHVAEAWQKLIAAAPFLLLVLFLIPRVVYACIRKKTKKIPIEQSMAMHTKDWCSHLSDYDARHAAAVPPPGPFGDIGFRSKVWVIYCIEVFVFIAHCTTILLTRLLWYEKNEGTDEWEYFMNGNMIFAQLPNSVAIGVVMILFTLGIKKNNEKFFCPLIIQIGVTEASAMLFFYLCPDKYMALWLRIVLAVNYILLQWLACYLVVGLHWSIRQSKLAGVEFDGAAMKDLSWSQKKRLLIENIEDKIEDFDKKHPHAL